MCNFGGRRMNGFEVIGGGEGGGGGGAPRRPPIAESKKKPGLNGINTSQRCIGTRSVQANVLIENC